MVVHRSWSVVGSFFPSGERTIVGVIFRNVNQSLGLRSVVQLCNTRLCLLMMILPTFNRKSAMEFSKNDASMTLQLAHHDSWAVFKFSYQNEIILQFDVQCVAQASTCVPSTCDKHQRDIDIYTCVTVA